MNNYHYDTSPPKGYTPYYDPASPYDSDYVYYAPQYEATPKRHSRKPSYVTTAERPGGWHSPTGYPSPAWYDKYYDFGTIPVNKEVSYVSPKKKGLQTKSRSYSLSERRPSVTTTPRKTSQPIRVYDEVEDAEVIYREPARPTKHAKKPSADQYFYFSQEQIYDEQPRRSRARRSSVSTKSPPKSSPKTQARPTATADDAERWNIPAGYSIKNWDPTEKPIVLLGSVFDANSLGKWIYDWTVYHHGASTPMADVAGDLWLLLIKLAGKMKRAEECVRRIRSMDAQDMVEDFIDSGTRLWAKFKQLLKECERFMWRAAKRDGSKGVSMGKNAGTEFVDSIFGRDRELENTEKIMNSIPLWNMRFDANCEEILRRPSVA